MKEEKPDIISQRTKEVHDIIDRMPHRTGKIVTVGVAFFAGLLIIFGFIIKYPESVTGVATLSAKQAPVRLTSPANGRLHILAGNSFEGQAASEAIRKTMFYARNENLSAVRKQVTGNTGGNPAMQNKVSAENRIDKKVAPEGFSVWAKPQLKSFNDIPLVCYYPIDMHGIVPQETRLIENGMLKNLLCGRTPTGKIKQPNGHVRMSFSSLNPMIVPGVIEVDYKDAVSNEELKKKLIEMAKEEGLDYALIVREMTPNMSELRRVYKVDINTGAETLVRSAAFKGLTMNDLRKISGAGNKKIVLNTAAGEDIRIKWIL